MLSLVNCLIGLFTLLTVFYFIFKNNSKKSKTPPGPPLGGIFSTGSVPLYVKAQKWAEKYGPLIRMKFGLTDAIIIDDPKLIREAFNENAFSGRMDHKFFTLLSGGKSGISTADGPEWAEQRRFVVRTLRDFGFGKRSMEGFIMAEVEEFVNWMKVNEGIPVAMDRRFVLATVNSLWTLIAGERIDQENAVVDEIIERVNQIFTEAGQTSVIFQLFPKLIDILPKIFLGSWFKVLARVEPLIQIFRDAVKHHLEHPADENSPRDLIDVYLTEIKRTTDPNSSFYQSRGHNSLIAVIGDLYGAGQGTTSNTLTWSVLYLSTFPEVQRKLHAELDQVIGSSRLPSLTDRPNLPYTEALMMEIFRFSSITPLGVFHEAMEDAPLGNYLIKKGSIIMPNIYSVHFSKKIWGDPENFRPERFLTEDGKNVVKSENLLAFSTGKRQCLGETLARDNFFLFLTSIFQRFEIFPDPAQPSPSLEPKKGFFREAKPFTVLIKERI